MKKAMFVVCGCCWWLLAGCADEVASKDCYNNEECNDGLCVDGFCECSAGYTGKNCLACAEGYHEEGDGCAEDVPTCEQDAECDNGNVCDGVETCDPVNLVCLEGNIEKLGLACDTDDDLASHEFCDGAGICLPGRCGDEVVDPDDEDCDDGNAQTGDGCDFCVYSCETDLDCNDSNMCNGEETCNPSTHACVPAEVMPVDGTDCGTDHECREGICVTIGCGNGVPNTGEDCDDGNTIENDGCKTDCSFSCTADADCDDGDVCTGTETCNVDDHICVDGTLLDCVDDGDDCTESVCDPLAGCLDQLIDDDGDGHAAESLGACGDDCDDLHPEVYAGAPELCDGLDNDCDGNTDEDPPTWYIDCDVDGYAADTSGAKTQCDRPSSATTGCSGDWTTVRPVGISSTDCRDDIPSVNPGQRQFFTAEISGTTSFDYNCDGVEEKQDTTKFKACSTGAKLCTGSGWADEPPACGVAAAWVACTQVGLTCTPSNLARKNIQACR